MCRWYDKTKNIFFTWLQGVSPTFAIRRRKQWPLFPLVALQLIKYEVSEVRINNQSSNSCVQANLNLCICFKSVGEIVLGVQEVGSCMMCWSCRFHLRSMMFHMMEFPTKPVVWYSFCCRRKSIHIINASLSSVSSTVL